MQNRWVFLRRPSFIYSSIWFTKFSTNAHKLTTVVTNSLLARVFLATAILYTALPHRPFFHLSRREKLILQYVNPRLQCFFHLLRRGRLRGLPSETNRLDLRPPIGSCGSGRAPLERLVAGRSPSKTQRSSPAERAHTASNTLNKGRTC